MSGAGEQNSRLFRASNPRASAWVAANAGAGKTYLLTTRVARLLLSGCDPARILCLTYTKAAAAEMTDRLYAILSEWALLDDDALRASLLKRTGERADTAALTRARRLFAEALETPGGLKIQTIHAFCERVLKRFPLEAGLPPAFTILDEAQMQEALTRATDRMLADAAAGRDAPLARAVDTLARQFEASVLRKALGETLRDRRHFKRLMDAGADAEALATRARELLGVGAGETWDGALDAICTTDAARETALKRAIAALMRGGSKDQKLGQALGEFLVASDRSIEWSRWRELFITKSENTPRTKLIHKEAEKFDPSAKDILTAEQERWVHLDAIKAAEISAALVRVAARVLAHYESEKAARAALDFDDLVASTEKLLSRAETAQWVLYKLDGGIEHILVDEAQDTSPRQWNVIAQIAAEFFAGRGAHDGPPRTVFAVGDDKQSIYSFQGADPHAFAEWRDRFATKAGNAGHAFENVGLSDSFRSAAPVLQAADAIFEGPAKAAVSASDTIRHIVTRQGEAGRVELWPLCANDATEEREAWDAPLDQQSAESGQAKLAERIARQVQLWLDSGETLASQGRAIRPGDILVLVQRRNAFAETLIRKFKEYNIPVAGADRLHLAAHIAVQDLIALGQFALLPSDDLTLAALLKSPLCGLSEDDLFTIAHDRAGSLWASLSAHAAGGGAFARAHDYLTRILALAARATPFGFYAEVLGPLGGRRAFVARLGAEAHDPLDEFLNATLRFERDRTAHLQSFLLWFARESPEVKRDLDKGQGEVRLMTVHGAKGLEAEIVFLPDTARPLGLGQEPPLLPYGDALVWKSGVHEAVQKAKDAREAELFEENMRLFYVALTRARDRLYLCGYQGAQKIPDDCWYRLAEAALTPLMEPASSPFEFDVLRLESAQTVPPRDTGAAAEAAMGDLTSEPKPLPDMRSRGTQAPSRLFAAPRRAEPLVARDGQRFKRGLLLHRLFELLPAVAPSAREAAAARFLKQASHALDPQAQAEIAASALRILGDSAFAPVFGPDSVGEAPIAGTLHGFGCDLSVHGQIDRIAFDGARILIVDFKTDRKPPGAPESVPAAYTGQLAVYRALLGQTFPGRTISCGLLWTETPQLMEMPQTLLDMALQQLRDRGAEPSSAP